MMIKNLSSIAMRIMILTPPVKPAHLQNRAMAVPFSHHRLLNNDSIREFIKTEQKIWQKDLTS